MIKYEDLTNNNYYNRTMADIQSASDERELQDVLKGLSYRLHYKEVEPESARKIIAAVNERIAALTSGGRRTGGGPQNGRGDKVISLSPTSVSNRAGAVSIVFLVVNIAITTAMYTILILSKLIG